jgi:hypothetical protein
VASAPGSSELSGSRELDEALAALDALAHPMSDRQQPAERDDDEPDDAFRPGGGLPSTTRPPWSRTSPPPQLVMRSPASRAYRRLKRIFPT